ncbi:esterase E4-like isoform X2 [Planococcus citri]|uniref:esterase E4-like isoform X2 n=1 Tax=Planococcus citri TaxID=170843 RepID=UPI0031F72BD6
MLSMKLVLTCFDSTYSSNICRDDLGPKVRISFLNALLPSKGEPLKTVIVNIHPGAFFHGSPDPSYYGSPDYIMNRDVVFVCVGYRLHILGDLNLNIRGCTGNQALKDVILSLKWIKENIHVFGGDPENITLMGSSSGSAIVHMLLLSPLADGLFHKAVLMGMYIFSPVLALREENASVAYEIACQLGYKETFDDKKKLLKFFKTVNMEMLLMLRPEVHFSQEPQVFPCSPFMPTPDFHNGETAIFPKPSPQLIPSTKRVPLMVGFCEREGAMVLPAIQRLQGTSLSEYFRKCIRLNPVGWGVNLNDDELTVIQKEVESFYLDGSSIEKASPLTKCDILTDAALSDVYDSLINVVSADLPSSVFVYNFAYDGKLCIMKHNFEPLLQDPLKGTFHGADYAHWVNGLQHLKKDESFLTQKDRDTIDRMTSLITTFAKNGDPNYEGIPEQWSSSTPEQPSYLKISETLESKDDFLNGERMKFWHNLKKQFNKNS